MPYMFMACQSLENLNLTSFTGEKIQNMTMMFGECKSLQYLNLTNFYANEGANIFNMFWDCNSLKKENLITNDKKILDELLGQIKYNKYY